MILQVYNSLQELSHSADKIFMSMVNGSNLSVVVPGGTTPRHFFKLLAQKIVDWILKDNLDVKFQLQLHKYIWPADKKGV